MKKLLAMLLACTMAMSLVACGDEEKDNDKDNDKDTSVTDTVSDADDSVADDDSAADDSAADDDSVADDNTDDNSTADDSSSDVDDDTDDNTGDDVELPGAGIIPEDSNLYAWQLDMQQFNESEEGFTMIATQNIEDMSMVMEIGILTETEFYCDILMDDGTGNFASFVLAYCDGEKTYTVMPSMQTVMISEGVDDSMVSTEETIGVDTADVTSFEYSTVELEGVEYDMEVVETPDSTVGFVFNEDGSLYGVYDMATEMFVGMEVKAGFDSSKMTYPENYTVTEA